MYEEVIKDRELVESDELESVKYVEIDDKIKLVTCFQYAYINAKLYNGDEVIVDAFNDKEPYDLLTHIFYLDKDSVNEDSEFTVTLEGNYGDEYYCPIKFSDAEKADLSELIKDYDCHYETVEKQEEQLSDGVIYRHLLLNDKDGAQTHAFMFEVDPTKATLYVGTPDDGYESVNVKATVPAMIDSANANGRNVIAAMNADFFDINGDHRPSGLCVKNGRVVANADSLRPFIGIKKDGTPVVTDLKESPEIVSELECAAAGIEMIIKDSEIYEWGPLEPFAYVRHPRTVAGIKADGTIIMLEVDGRIPEYSNGASLIDLANIMLEYGAVRAVNLDGGGSSITYTRGDDGYILRSNPADLYKPTEKLIREEYNCLLVVEK